MDYFVGTPLFIRLRVSLISNIFININVFATIRGLTSGFL